MFIFTGPFDAADAPGGMVMLEDHLCTAQEEPTRWGMSIDAYRNLFLVGGPRKDSDGTRDCGICYLLRNGKQPRKLVAPRLMKNGILGYRVRIADVIGDETPDLLLFSLPVGFFVVETDGGDKPVFVPRPIDACPHWACGNATGQVFAGGKEEIVLGGPDWEPDSFSDGHDSGRVHILKFD